MENFAVSTKAVSHSVYEDLTEETITILKKKVLNHKFFTIRFKSILPYARLGLQLLNDYVAEKADISVNEHTEPQITEDVFRSQPVSDEKEKPAQNSSYYETAGFYNWMTQNAHLSMNTSRSYNSAINTCDVYAGQSGIFQGSIRDCSSYSEFEEKYNLLMNDDEFRKLSESRHNYLIAALNKYRDYMISVSKGENSVSQTPDAEKISDEFAKKYGEILSQEFEDGYCIGDYMHRMRFQSAYEEKYGEESEKDSEELEILLKRIGQVRDDRIFYTDTSHNDLLSAIYEDMKQTFDNGATAVYYECLYEKYESKLISEMSVYSPDSLKTVMQNDSNFPMGYRTMKSYISKYGIEADSNEEIRKLLQSSHVPMTFEEIQAKVRHIFIEHELLFYNF